MSSAVHGGQWYDDDWTDYPYACILSDLSAWDRYPTHELYLSAMQYFAESYPQLCQLDTMGFSVMGRPILVARIASRQSVDNDSPQFLYAAAIHGDEMVTSLMALHLIDTLLGSYGSNQYLTNLVDSLQIFVAPLSNPDGAYYLSDNDLSYAQRCNANGIDLNRNFPDPFSQPSPVIEPENRALISFVASHRIVLSAQLHAGEEVLNYPWDGRRYSYIKHPDDVWWKMLCETLVAVARKHDYSALTSVVPSGYVAGGDWYVVNNGCQDYLNYYCGAHNLTMELSEEKMPYPDKVSMLWSTYADMLIAYIAMALKPIPHSVTPDYSEAYCTPFPNPTNGMAFVATPLGLKVFDMTNARSGVNIIKCDGRVYKIIKM